MHPRFPLLLLAGVVSLLRVAPALPAATLEMAVRHVVRGEPLRLDSLRYANAAGETLSVTRLSYLLGGFGLQREEDGNWVELPGEFAWMDAAGGRTRVRLENVPPGRYRALRFHVGPDPATNAADPARWPAGHPLNPVLNGLHWGWQGGYVFLAVEGHHRGQDPAATATPGGFSHHLARDGNRTRVELATPGLDLTRHDAGVGLDFDLDALLAAAGDGTGTHSRDGDALAATLAASLPGAFRLREVVSAAPVITQPAPERPRELPAAFSPYPFTIPRTFPIPDLPRDNPLTGERVALGRMLFHETALSCDGSISCASCHQENAGFSEGRHRFSAGVDGRLGQRRPMPLVNLAWKSSFFWDGRAHSLRAGVLLPIQDHAEMDEALPNVVAKLSVLPGDAYAPRFRAAFGTPEITPERIGLALENFLLTLTATRSRFDRALRGEAALSAEEQRGFALFTTERDPRTGQFGADCFHCHGGPLFSDHSFHDNGLGWDDADPGRLRATGREEDRGRFATPGLRNVALRAPYMHDGRFRTLEDVVAHYDHGVRRTPSLDPNLAKHPAGGLNLSPADQRALVAFLKTLTDEPPAPGGR